MASVLLNEDRKQAARPGAGKKELRMFNNSRPSQFVETWNSLLDRSASKRDDESLIFANIMDFSSAHIARLPVQDRLSRIIRSCHEVPTSLLFNTSAVISYNTNPRDSWIPEHLAGSRLVKNGTLVKEKSRFKDTITLSFNFGTSVDSSIITLLSTPQIPFDAKEFCVRTRSNDIAYVIVVRRPSLTGISISEHAIRNYEGRAKSLYNLGSGSCIILDKSTGSSSMNGYRARGARFSVRNIEKFNILLQFDSAVEAWESEQWNLKFRNLPLPHQTFTLTEVNSEQDLFLSINSTDWEDPLPQRFMLPAPDPKRAQRIGYALSMLAFIIATAVTQSGLAGCSTSTSTSGTCASIRIGTQMVILVVSNILTLYIIQYLRRRAFDSWLRTFEDTWGQSKQRSRCWSHSPNSQHENPEYGMDRI